MKIFAAGVKRQYGVGKTSQKPYDMMNLLALVPMEPGMMGAMSVDANGYELMELPIDSLATFQQFSAVKFPCIVEITVEPTPRMGKLVSTVTALLGTPPMAKAA